MNTPVNFDFPTHYKGDQLVAFTIQLQYETEEQVDLQGAVVRMQMRSLNRVIVWEFSTLLTGDNQLIVLPENQILFPNILSWTIVPGLTYYDLQVITPGGQVQTYVKGTWKVNQEITI